MKELVDTLQKEFGLPEAVAVGLLVFALLSMIERGIRGTIDLLGWIRRKLTRLFLGEDRAVVDEREDGRAAFARAQLRRLGVIDFRDGWDDVRFADLEAEVETEMAARSRLGLDRFRSGSQTRRERSLTSALTKLGFDRTRRQPRWRRGRRGQRIVFLHGAPGSGKSVALRRVARNLAEKASKEPMTRPIPLYVNLNKLVVPKGPVTPQVIREYVVASQDELTTPETRAFLEGEFPASLREGRHGGGVRGSDPGFPRGEPQRVQCGDRLAQVPRTARLRLAHVLHQTAFARATEDTDPQGDPHLGRSQACP
jgi:hypothetical protein